MHSAFCTWLASPQTSSVFTAAGTVFGTTDVYELGFSYLCISIFSYQMSNQWNLFTFNFLAITRWFCDKYDKLAALEKVVVDTACVVLHSYFNNWASMNDVTFLWFLTPNFGETVDHKSMYNFVSLE